jgi:hypothetical protein
MQRTNESWDSPDSGGDGSILSFRNTQHRPAGAGAPRGRARSHCYHQGIVIIKPDLLIHNNAMVAIYVTHHDVVIAIRLHAGLVYTLHLEYNSH